MLLVTMPDGRKLRRTLYGGGDTHSQSARVLEVGLGDGGAPASALLLWPSGLTQRLDGAAGFALDETLAVVEPAWLTLSARVAASADEPPLLRYTAVDDAGAALGAAGAGRTVTATRSDGLPVVITDHGDGTYSAPLPHPGAARVTTVAITVDGATQRPRPSDRFD